MREQTALLMNQVNARFYAAQAASFDKTRQDSWPGWERCLDLCLQDPDWKREFLQEATGTIPTVFDVACGNLRFARFLAERLAAEQSQAEKDAPCALPISEAQTTPATPISQNTSSTSAVPPLAYAGIDNSDEMLRKAGPLPAQWQVSLSRLDIVAALLGNTPDASLEHLLGSTKADLVVSFGFFHHVPTYQARERLLDALLSCTRTGGICCVSLWRFMSNEKLAAKAQKSTAMAREALGLAPEDLDRNDYLLGWQDRRGAFRYCHHFDNDEIGSLARAVSHKAQVMASFEADGRTGNLNGYLVFKKA